MIDDVSDIQQLYNRDPAYEHERLVRHQLEWDLTWRYLNDHLPQQGPILEIGAGPGRYTVELARRGYQVTAVDLSDGLLNLNRSEIAKQGLAASVAFISADIRDLSAVHQADYTAALVMGPLYHLATKKIDARRWPRSTRGCIPAARSFPHSSLVSASLAI